MPPRVARARASCWADRSSVCASQGRLLQRQQNEVGLFDDWLRRTPGFEPIGQWVMGENAHGRKSAVFTPLLDASGRKVFCSEAPIVEYLMKMAHGDAASVPKGGDPEYRNGEQYRSKLGRRQGDLMAVHEKEFGYGAHADQPYRYVTIEKKLYALRWWFSVVRCAAQWGGVGDLGWVHASRAYPILCISKGACTARQVPIDDERANPAWRPRICLCMSMLARWLGRKRVNEPVPLTRMHVAAAQAKTVMTDQNETAMLTYMMLGLPLGRRAIDFFLLDWSEVTFKFGGDANGAVLSFLVSKTNREAREKPQGLQCLTCCDGESPVGRDGKLREGRAVCPAHLLLYLKELQAKQAGVSVDDLIGPVLATYKKVTEVPCGQVLVAADDGSSSGDAPDGVHVVSRSEEARGELPSWSGCWFELAGLGCACQAWGNNEKLTPRLRTHLRKCNKRAGKELVPASEIKSLTSKSARVGMATLGRDEDVSMHAIVEQGEWETEAIARGYVHALQPLSTRRCNWSDLAFGPRTEGERMAVEDAREVAHGPRLVGDDVDESGGGNLVVSSSGGVSGSGGSGGGSSGGSGGSGSGSSSSSSRERGGGGGGGVGGDGGGSGSVGSLDDMLLGADEILLDDAEVGGPTAREEDDFTMRDALQLVDAAEGTDAFYASMLEMLPPAGRKPHVKGASQRTRSNELIVCCEGYSGVNMITRRLFDAEPERLRQFNAACEEGGRPEKIQKILCETCGIHTKRREIMNMRQKLRGHSV